MIQSEIITTGLMLTAIVFVVIGTPCALIAWIGSGMLRQLAYFPSKTPAIQMSVLFKLIVIEMATFTMLIILFRILAVVGE